MSPASILSGPEGRERFLQASPPFRWLFGAAVASSAARDTRREIRGISCVVDWAGRGALRSIAYLSGVIQSGSNGFFFRFSDETSSEISRRRYAFVTVVSRKYGSETISSDRDFVLTKRITTCKTTANSKRLLDEFLLKNSRKNERQTITRNVLLL